MPMNRYASILFSLAFILTVAVPRHLQAIPGDEMMAQAMRCQPAVYCYAFFSTLPLKILSQLHAEMPVAGTRADAGDTSERHERGTDEQQSPLDISLTAHPTLIKTLSVHPAGSGIGAPSALACSDAVVDTGVRVQYCDGAGASAARHWMVTLPRGSLDDHILKTIDAVNEPIAASPRLAFSLGGNV